MFGKGAAMFGKAGPTRAPTEGRTNAASAGSKSAAAAGITALRGAAIVAGALTTMSPGLGIGGGADCGIGNGSLITRGCGMTCGRLIVTGPARPFGIAGGGTVPGIARDRGGRSGRPCTPTRGRERRPVPGRAAGEGNATAGMFGGQNGPYFVSMHNALPRPASRG
jgi:hypothetical protein